MSEGEGTPWGISGTLRYRLDLPVETPSNNVIKGMHFHAYKTLRQQWQLMVKASLKGAFPDSPVERSFLVIERRCSGGGLDWDNAYGGLKPVLDCLVRPSARNPDGLGIIEDDNPKNMPFPPFLKQTKAKVGQGSSTIFIYELNE